MSNMIKHPASEKLYQSKSNFRTCTEDLMINERTSNDSLLNFNNLIYPDFHLIEKVNFTFDHCSWHPEIENVVSSNTVSSGYLVSSQNVGGFNKQQVHTNDNYTVVQGTEFGTKSYCVLQNSTSPLARYNQENSSYYSNQLKNKLESSNVSNSNTEQHQTRRSDSKIMNVSCFPSLYSPAFYPSLENSEKDIPSAECLTLYNCSFEDFVSTEEISPYSCDDQTKLNSDETKQDCLLEDISKISECITFNPDYIYSLHENTKLDDRSVCCEPSQTLNVSDCLNLKCEDNTLKICPAEESIFTDPKISDNNNLAIQKLNLHSDESNNFSTKYKENGKFTSSNQIEYSNTATIPNQKQFNKVTVMIIQPSKYHVQKCVSKNIHSSEFVKTKSDNFLNFHLESNNKTDFPNSSCAHIPDEINKNSHCERPKVMYSANPKSSFVDKIEPKITERRFSNESDTVEIATEKPMEPSKCRICREFMYTQTPLKKHFRVAVEKVVDVCSACNICFLQKPLLAAVQNNKKPYQCNYCNKRFSKKSEFQSHVKDHVTIKPFKCTDCDRTFARKAQLTLHSKIHKVVQPLVCGVCDKNFISKSHLNHHFKVHTGELPKTNLPPRDLPTSPSVSQEVVSYNTFHCLICDKSFSIRSLLNQHLKEHSEEKLHYCDTCNRAFIQRSNLRYHSKACRVRMERALFNEDSNKLNPDVSYEIISLDNDL